MDIHEYQAKEILAGFGVPMPRGGIAYSPEQACYRAHEIGGDVWVVKAQIHSGSRGKAGGVKICHDEKEVRNAAMSMLGSVMVTNQTGAGGKMVQRLYVEEGIDIRQEIYLGLVLDRKTERVMVAASVHGGADIEEHSGKRPESLVSMSVDAATGMKPFHARKITYALGLNNHVRAMSDIVLGCYRAFNELDAEMVEINPLVLTANEQLLALDAKMSFDENALFRHSDISELRDKSQEDRRESYAADRGLNYIGLNGDIGCIINGAGLAMASMDMIKLTGGEPANFLDIGGGASPDRVRMAFQSVLQDKNVKVILINIFAGINRCDWIAEGIIQAFEKLNLTLPVVVRLSGTNVEKGRQILSHSNLPLIVADTLTDAAEKAVRAASGENTET